MANIFYDIVVVKNGTSAPVDVSAAGAFKTVTVSGSFSGVLELQVSVNGGADFAAIKTVTRGGKFNLKVANKYFRVVSRGADPHSTFSPEVQIGASADGTYGVDIPGPPKNGVGASVDIELLGRFSTFQVSGEYSGSLIIEVSEDGVNFADCIVFSTTEADIKSKDVIANFARVRSVGASTTSAFSPSITMAGANPESLGGVAGEPIGPAGGDLGGVYPDPTVVRITEGGASTSLNIGAVSDAQWLARSGTNLIGVAAPSLGNIGSGTLADLNALVTDATLDDASASRTPTGTAGGDLSGTYPDPSVVALTADGTRLTLGTVSDGQLLRRAGSTLVGTAPSAGGNTLLWQPGGTTDAENNVYATWAEALAAAEASEVRPVVLVDDSLAAASITGSAAITSDLILRGVKEGKDGSDLTTLNLADGAVITGAHRFEQLRIVPNCTASHHISTSASIVGVVFDNCRLEAGSATVSPVFASSGSLLQVQIQGPYSFVAPGWFGANTAGSGVALRALDGVLSDGAAIVDSPAVYDLYIDNVDCNINLTNSGTAGQSHESLNFNKFKVSDILTSSSPAIVNSFNRYDTTAGNISQQLSLGEPGIYIFANLGGSNNLLLDPQGSYTINGGAADYVVEPGSAAVVVHDGVNTSGNWQVIGWFKPDGGVDTLQEVYDVSSAPHIVVGADGLVVQDNATPIAGDVFSVKDNTTASLFGVGTAGASVSVPLTVRESGGADLTIGAVSDTQWLARSGTNLIGVAAPTLANIGAGTLAELNAQVTDATLDDASASRTPTGAAGGDLSGTYPNPAVAAVTSGGTQLTIGAIDDGEVLLRSGTQIISGSLSATPTGPAGGDLSGTYPNPSVVKITEGGLLASLGIGAVSDTQWLARSGTNIVGVAAPSLGNIGSGTLADLNALVTDATLDDASASRTPTGTAGGNLSGSYPNPSVVGITEAGAVSLGVGIVSDGQWLARSGTNLIGVAAPSLGNIGSGTLADLNALVTDATLDDASASRTPTGTAGGNLSGSYPNPSVVGITEAGLSTSLGVGAISDGQYLQRSGTSIVGVDLGAADIKALYESNANTNAFTDAEKSKLLGIEAGAEVNNISDANALDLTDGGDSALHFHASDRDRANHTGTQTASTISDFDAEVSNNATVVANTAKVSADGSVGTHSDVDLAGNATGHALIYNGAAFAPVQLTGQHVNLPTVPGSTYATVEEMNTLFHSSGVTTWTGATDNGNGTINVAAGTGLIRPADSVTADLLFTDWTAATALAMVDGQTNYIYVDYNAGSPVVASSTVEPTQYNTIIMLATVFRDGLVCHINSKQQFMIGDHAALMIRRSIETMPFARVSGGILSESGTLNIAISSGSWWEGLTPFTTPALDTSGADTFNYHYYDGAAWQKTTGVSQIDNTSYNNTASGLVALTSNRYGVHWVYLGHDGDIDVVYGTGDYTLIDANEAGPPSALPPILQGDHSRLAGKIVVQEGATVFTSVTSAFTATFSQTVATAHENLVGLQGGATGEYYHATAAEYADIQAVGPHIASTSNPHAVTASQIGLGNVLNVTQEPAITAGTTAQYWRGDKSWQTLNTTAVPEGSNLYYTQGRFDTAFAAKSTTNLSEGTNLYYTDARVRATPLTGFVVGANSAIAATDTVLTAFGKTQGQINARATTTALTTHTGDATIHFTEASINHANIVGAGTNTHAQIDTHIASAANPHAVTAAQVGAYTTGATDTLLDAKVSGPASATDNAIARFDATTGKLIQDSAAIIDDSGNVGLGNPTIAARLHVKGSGSTSATFALKIDNLMDTQLLGILDDGFFRFNTTNSNSSISGLLNYKLAMPDAHWGLSNLGGQAFMEFSNGSISGFPGHLNTSQGYVIGATSNHPLSFRSGSNRTRAILDVSGNFYIVDAGTGALPVASARLHVKGSGATSATYNLKLNNSTGTQLFHVRDDGAFAFKGGTVGPAQTGYTTFTNLVTGRTCDANTATAGELADILGTLIEDLKTKGIIAA